MAVRRRVDRVCDLCGGEEAKRYRLELVEIQRRMTVDLCAEHGAPFEELNERLPHQGGGRAGLKRREVVSEATVRKARKAPPKKKARA